MTQVVVVGAGLTGLFASVLAGRRGAQVTLLAQGRGGLALGPGRIEVWADTRPLHGFSASPAAHPYRRLHASDLRNAILALQEILSGFGVSYQGSLDRNQHLPTLLGTLRPAALAPLSQVLAKSQPRGNLAIAGIEGFRDFHPGLALGLRSANLRTEVYPNLPSPIPTGKRDWYATDLALAFDSLEDLPRLAQEWRLRLRNCDALALPAVLGLDQHAHVFSTLRAELGIPITEIPTLPPCVPGLRLERALRAAALAEGVRLVEGSRAVGRVSGKPRARRVDGVAALTPGGMRFHSAHAVILATGGALHGGWEAPSLGRARESVFGFPLHTGNRGVHWTEESMSAAQPYAFFGLRVDRWLRPLAADNKPAFENVFAAGGILAGADRAGEGSRQGIDLATAYRAVEAALS